MIKVLSGDWPAGISVKCGGTFDPRPTHMVFRKGFSPESIALSDIARAQLISTDNAVGNSVGLGIAGAALFGPLGALMGAEAAKKAQQTLVAVIFKDGRKAILGGPSSELAPIIAAGFAWEELSPKAPDEPPTIEIEADHNEVVDIIPERARIEPPQTTAPKQPSTPTKNRAFGRRNNPPSY